MSESDKLKASHLARLAVVYVRQSSMAQVHGNLESQRRQYALAEQARTLGFHKVEIIDQDLGRSASGSAMRPGFEHLVALVLSGQVGAVLCIEASRREMAATGITCWIYALCAIRCSSIPKASMMLARAMIDFCWASKAA